MNQIKYVSSQTSSQKMMTDISNNEKRGSNSKTINSPKKYQCFNI